MGAGGDGEGEDDFGECGDTFLPESSGGCPDAAAPYVVIPRPHREPESSDMSEDEAANKRYGRLYQDIETEKDEVLKPNPKTLSVCGSLAERLALLDPRTQIANPLPAFVPRATEA